MPGSTRKTADTSAAPAADATPATTAAVESENTTAQDVQPKEGVAEETVTAQPSAAPPAEESRPAVTVVFHGQAQSFTAGVGLCDPDGEYPVPAAVADHVCRGDAPLFTRAQAA